MRNALVKVLGLLCVIYGVSMLPPIAVSLIYADGCAVQFLGIGLAAVVLGSIAVLLGPPTDPHLPSRGGFLIVAASWFFLSLLAFIGLIMALIAGAAKVTDSTS